MEVNTWERRVWDRTEGGVILVISLGAGSSVQKEWGTRMAAEGLLEVTSGEGGTVRMEGAEEAGILGFLGDGEGTVSVPCFLKQRKNNEKKNEKEKNENRQKEQKKNEKRNENVPFFRSFLGSFFLVVS